MQACRHAAGRAVPRGPARLPAHARQQVGTPPSPPPQPPPSTHLEVRHHLALRKPAAVQRALRRGGRRHRPKLLRRRRGAGARWRASVEAARGAVAEQRTAGRAGGAQQSQPCVRSRAAGGSPRRRSRARRGRRARAPRARTWRTRRARPPRSRGPTPAPSPCRGPGGAGVGRSDCGPLAGAREAAREAAAAGGGASCRAQRQPEARGDAGAGRQASSSRRGSKQALTPRARTCF